MLNEKTTFQYETIGNKSFLIGTLKDPKDLINYQMQMLANNEILNILPVNKRQKNDDIQLCYNVTSRVSLIQAMSRSKISRRGFIELIEGVISVFNELGEYQLVSSGLVLEYEYIFVKTGSFEPHFIYMPTNSKDLGIAPLKEFLFSLILQSKVEMTNDNFIQVVLEALNSPSLSIDDLAKITKEYGKKAPIAPQITLQPVNQQIKTPEFQAPLQPKMIQQSFAGQDQLGGAESIAPRAANSSNQARIPQKQQSDGSKEGDTKKSKKKNQQTKEQHPKKNTFLLTQIGILAVIVAISMTGFINNEDGSMNYTYLAGLLILAAGVDFVLYREWFVNSGKQKPKNEKHKKAKKSDSIANVPGIAIPGKAPVEPVVQQKPIVRPESRQQSVAPHLKPATDEPQRQSTGNLIQSESLMERKQDSFYSNPVGEAEMDETVVLAESDSIGTYLEYYENGLLVKILLNKPSVIVGRMKNQVDYVINSKKVGRIHAEFISDGNNFYVKDYNSTNGTYINGEQERIPGNTPHQIFNGDKIVLANVELTLRC